MIKQEITGGKGVDIAVEALGRSQTFSQCIRSVRDGGKAVMIGLTLSGAIGEVDINHLVRRQVCSFSQVVLFNLFCANFLLGTLEMELESHVIEITKAFSHNTFLKLIFL